MIEYFKNEFQRRMFLLEYDDGSSFYLGPCQTSDSPVPLLILRPFLLAIALTAIFYSQITYGIEGRWNWWYIYLTHWGLMTVLLSTAFSIVVSCVAYFSSDSDDDDLPWYVKIYWVLYNIATPLSMLITIFFWTVLYKKGSPIPLALCGHGTNTVVMVVLLLSSRQPSRVLHFYQPFFFAVTWAFFSVIYHLCGGTNTEGKKFIYAVVDWSKPGWTSLVVFLTAVALGVFHLLVVGVAALRDWLGLKITGEGV
ncbi:hypothetical protein NE865_02944 [Phthorimaea operculella]|nr:hypothetical protein NE865_02944 [Phthorimaea operculella]